MAGIIKSLLTDHCDTRMNLIRKFLYRSPRFKADLRMDFVLGDTVFLGTCTDLSESGLRGTFSEELAAGSEGWITLYHDDQPFQVCARVYSVRGGEARVRFSFSTDKERTAMTDLIKTLASRSRG